MGSRFFSVRRRFPGFVLAIGALVGVASCSSTTVSTENVVETAVVDNTGRVKGENDGRMLQPEGHEGIWFETEPEGEWERYVWRSQKFVGAPLELPPLEGADIGDELRGFPDFCSEGVVNRLSEVGLAVEERQDYVLMTSCIMKTLGGDGTDLTGDMVNLRSTVGMWSDVSALPEAFSSHISYEGIQRIPDSGFGEQCVAEIAEHGGRYALLTRWSPIEYENLEENCRTIRFVRQVIQNVTSQ